MVGKYWGSESRPPENDSNDSVSSKSYNYEGGDQDDEN